MANSDEAVSVGRNEQSVREDDGSHGDLSYEDIDISVSSGYKPMVAVAVLTILSFFLFGGGLPIYWGEAEGYTLFTYGSVLWGTTIIILGFAYEFWVERNETANDTKQVTNVRGSSEGERQ